MILLQLVSVFVILCNSLVICGPVTLSSQNKIKDNVCNHKHPLVDDIPHHVHLEHKHHVMKRNADQNLRIKVFYDSSVENLPRKKRNVVKRKVLKSRNGKIKQFTLNYFL